MTNHKDLEPITVSDAQAMTLVDDAERVLATVESAESAESLFHKISVVSIAAKKARIAHGVVIAMQRVRLRAERRWGELLGPAESAGAPAGNSNAAAGNSNAANNVTDRNIVSGPDRKAQHTARQVAAVPEPVFDEYVEQDDPDDLTRAGLLRHAAEQPSQGDVDLAVERTQQAEALRREREISLEMHGINEKMATVLSRIERFGVWIVGNDYRAHLETARRMERQAGEIRAALEERVNEERA